MWLGWSGIRVAGFSVEAVIRQSLHTAHDLPPSFPRLQPAHYVLKTIRSYIWPRTPEDGHNGARNMLS